MKKLFLLSALSLIAFKPFAQCSNELHSTVNGGARILSTQGNTPANPAIGFHSTAGTCGNPQEDGGGGNGIFRPLANVMGFATSSTERMRITPGGAIGIGTQTPVNLLEVSSGSPSVDGIMVRNTNATGSAVLKLKSQAAAGREWGFASTNTGFLSLYDYTGSVGRFVINGNNGNVGIANTNPGVRLDMNVSASNDGMRISQTGTTSATLSLTGGGTVGTGATQSRRWSLHSTGSGNFQGAGHLLFFDWTNNKERMRIHQNGYVGINTAVSLSSGVPTNMLHVKAESTNTDPVRFEGLRTSTDSLIVTSDASGVLHTRNISTLGVGISNSCSTVGNVPVTSSATGNLACSQITDNGTGVGIGTSTPTEKLHVMGGVQVERNDGSNQTNALSIGITSNAFLSPTLAPGTINFVSKNLTSGALPDMSFSADGLTHQLVIKNNGDVGIGTVPTSGYKLDVNGNVRSTSLLVTSDEKYKKDIEPIKNATEIVNKLTGVTYNWKKEEYKNKNFSSKQQLGFIAQDVEKVLPQAVEKDANGDYAVNYIEIIPVLTEAIKLQQKQIEELKQLIADGIGKVNNSEESTTKFATATAPEVELSNTPNPFQSRTTINYSLPVGTEQGMIEIYDINGLNIQKIELGSNQGSVIFDMSMLQSGTYIASLYANGSLLKSIKMSLVK